MSGHLSPKRIQNIESILGYKFVSKLNLLKALEAAGATSTPEGNKRLGLIGISVLRLAVILKGFENNYSTSDMSKAETTTATTGNLAEIGFSKTIDQFVHVNPCQGTVSHRLMATTLAAIIASVYIDSGHSMKVITELIKNMGLI
ncbi:RNAse III [Penicillium angulare]|uniref:RNAse III n=1 Tax=Penicillium angulare TaxID=116970 RepID=A0A9W9JVP8_9EURO|nr:RNAse III [Penicillium angulare]